MGSSVELADPASGHWHLLEIHHCCTTKVPRSVRGRCPTSTRGGALPLLVDSVNFLLALAPLAALQLQLLVFYDGSTAKASRLVRGRS